MLFIFLLLPFFWYLDVFIQFLHTYYKLIQIRYTIHIVGGGCPISIVSSEFHWKKPDPSSGSFWSWRFRTTWRFGLTLDEQTEWHKWKIKKITRQVMLNSLNFKSVISLFYSHFLSVTQVWRILSSELGHVFSNPFTKASFLLISFHNLAVMNTSICFSLSRDCWMHLSFHKRLKFPKGQRPKAASWEASTSKCTPTEAPVSFWVFQRS